MAEAATREATTTEAVSPQQRQGRPSAGKPTEPAKADRRTYRTVRELVQEMRAFRSRLADALRAAGLVEDDERVRRFLDDMEQRDRQRRGFLEQLAESDSRGLDTWRQNLPTRQLADAIREVDQLVERARSSDEDLDLEAVVSSSLAIESRAAKIYRDVAESVSAESSRELLEDLAEVCEAAAADRAWAYHETRQV